MKRALTIAGSDSGGGAGIQADLKTFMAFGVHGMSALTAITAQNTVGVQAIHDLPLDIIAEQIKSVVLDIGVDAVKIGMLSNPAIATIVAESITKYKLPNIVVDPVMVAKSGDSLLTEEARDILKEKVLPLATVITPNLLEAEELIGSLLETTEDIKTAAVELKKTGCQWVVIKGGHRSDTNEAIDIIYDGREFYKLQAPFIQTKNTHGTGCTFSSAIAAGLAKGYEPLKAIERAKHYITEAIKSSLALGKGHGPTNHLTGVQSEW
jgi:hydroxymethylpyrimidine/phosphomethylpyrimidine kinase